MSIHLPPRQYGLTPSPSRATAGAALLLAAMAHISCAETSWAPGLDRDPSAHRPIVGGSPESGWRSVGALTYESTQVGYLGSFCTGTLIDAEWVLTAAHCLTDSPDYDMEPGYVSLFLGADANPDAYGDRPAGDVFAAGAFHIHPDYNDDPYDTDNDIALLQLAEPASGEAIYSHNTSTLTAEVVGEQALYVGYGAVEGISVTGGGVKRSASIEITAVNPTEYESEYQGTGVCYGDSGGPGLLEIDGAWRVIGVNSHLTWFDDDPCRGGYAHTRVDAFADWIAETMGQELTPCYDDPQRCACTAACQADGSCDNAACATWGCEEVYSCQTDCASGDMACESSCRSQGTPVARTQVDELLGCFSDECGTYSEYDPFIQCVASYCSQEIDTCFPPDNCAITGGGCPVGEACYPTITGSTTCYGSDGRGRDQSCTVDQEERLSCGDGLICIPDDAGDRCRGFCRSDGDCDGDTVCEIPIFDDVAEIGVCLGCTDGDRDGHCLPADCDDSRSSDHPGASEVCGDGRDNDCDGRVDESCSDAGVGRDAAVAHDAGGSADAAVAHDAGGIADAGTTADAGDKPQQRRPGDPPPVSGDRSHVVSCIGSAYRPPAATLWPLAAVAALGAIRQRRARPREPRRDR